MYYACVCNTEALLFIITEQKSKIEYEIKVLLSNTGVNYTYFITYSLIDEHKIPFNTKPSALKYLHLRGFSLDKLKKL